MKMRVGVVNNCILQATLLFYVRCAVVRHTKRREGDHAISISCGVELEQSGFFTRVLSVVANPPLKSVFSLLQESEGGGGRGASTYIIQ